MAGRPPNEVERKLHQAALTDPKKELTAKQSEVIVPDLSDRRSALNFLLGVGLFKLLKDAKGNVSFRAVLKNEMNATKDLGGEESLVLGHIKSSGNEGIWTKHLKGKTELHQTVIDRCLKTLMQKQLIKVVKSVKHPTRKIYMLSHLEPSVELTGGPWYTDNELDTEFIKLLCNACLRFIQEKSFPKRRSEQTSIQLYSIANAPQYPTAQTIQQFLKQSRITETELSVEHIEMLLNVLVLDGDVEKMPAYGLSMWDSAGIENGSDSEDEKSTKSKRKRKGDDEDSRKKKRRKKAQSSDEESPAPKKSRKKSKKKSEDTEEDSEDEKKLKSKKKQKKEAKEESDEDSSDEEDRKKKSKKSRKSKRHDSSSESESSSESSSTDSDSKHRRSRSRSKSKRSKSKSVKRSPSPTGGAFDDFEFALGSSHVYRAIRQERVALGWSQAPCAKCPSFDFCNDKGPVNARECVYYGDWLGTAVGAKEE